MPKKKKQIKEKSKIGRPSSFTIELGDKICARLSNGESLRTVCLDDDMPSTVTVFSWMRTIPEFLSQYTRAKEESADALIEEMNDIADNGTNDWVETTSIDGSNRMTLNKEHVQRSRLRIETRKWIASKLKPKKYGEKLDLTTGGEKIQTASDFLNLINAGATKVQGQGVESVPLGVLQDQKQAG